MRDGRCLLGHSVDPSTISRSAGRHAAQPLLLPPEPPPRPAPAPTLAPPPAADPPRQVHDPVGALSPTGTLVAALWEATSSDEELIGWELSPDPLSDTGRGHRLGRIVAATLAVAVIGTVGWLGTNLTGRRAQAERSDIVGASAGLVAALTAAIPLAEDIADGDLADVAEAATATARMTSRARDLYNAAEAAASEDVAPLRLTTTEQAGQATALGAVISDAVAYDGILATLVDHPELPVSTAEGDVTATASDVAWWVTEAGALSEALPDGEPLAGHRREVGELVAWLGGWQVSYLDALTAGDAQAAAVERRAVLDRLDDLEASWHDTFGAIGEDARRQLADLVDAVGEISRSG